MFNSLSELLRIKKKVLQKDGTTMFVKVLCQHSYMLQNSSYQTEIFLENNKIQKSGISIPFFL